MKPLFLRSLIFSTCALFTFLFFASTPRYNITAKTTSTYTSTRDWLKSEQKDRLAYATFLAGTQADLENITATEDTLREDKYFTAARLLGYHLMHKPSTRTRKNIPYVVMATKGVPLLEITRLKKDGAIVVAVDSQPTGEWFHPYSARWNDVMTKLRLWQLEQYDRIAFLDVDSALTAPLDGVFEDAGAALINAVPNPQSPLDIKTESALPEKYLMASTPETKRRHAFPPTEKDFLHGPDYFNAGFFVFSPSNVLHAHYTSLTSNTTKPKFKSGCPEQNLLNYAHRRNGPMPWTSLESKWNIVLATKSDIDKGAVSIHSKWWDAKALSQWFDREIAEMEGYYSAMDEMRSG